MTWKLVYAKQAAKDAKKIASKGLKEKAKELLALIAQDPFQNPPPYKKLVGQLNGYYSRRINIQHRLVYQIDTEQEIVKIIRMWTHYND